MPAPAAWVIAPVSVIAPVELTASVPVPTLEVPSTVGALGERDIVRPAVVQRSPPR